MNDIIMTPIRLHELELLIEKSVKKVIGDHLVSKPVISLNEELLNASQAAEFLGLSIQTIYGKIHNKELPVHKPPGCKRVYFRKNELLGFVSQGRVKTNAEIEVEASKPSEKPITCNKKRRLSP